MLAEVWAELNRADMSAWAGLGTMREMMQKYAARVIQEMPEEGLGGAGSVAVEALRRALEGDSGLARLLRRFKSRRLALEDMSG